MSQQAGGFEKCRQPPKLPFGYRWHLEVSPHTYLLLERKDARTNDKTSQRQPAGLPEARSSQVEIELLNLEREWDVGFALDIDDAWGLLNALEGRTLVRTLNWVVEPEWVTLYDQPVTCEFELTLPVRSALILRLRTVLKGHVVPNEERERW